MELSKHTDLMEMKMTDLTANKVNDENLFSSFLASLPTAADLFVLSIGAILTACLNLML